MYGRRNVFNNVFPILSTFFFVKGSDNNTLINILIWEQLHFTPMFDYYQGQQYFINQNCSFQNCFITGNRSFLSDVRLYDVILFNAIALRQSGTILPSNRLVHQIFIFMSNEPAAMYQLATHYNGFFNYTFTYKLNSDITWRFFVVTNKNGEIVAPKVDVKWIDVDDMEPISDEIKRKLQTKSKAAAWHVSHCYTPSRREEFVEKLIPELARYKLNIDISGACGNLYCQAWTEECYTAIETDYYFYLAFENSMCDDYVSEKILKATQHFSVPIVFGGANYSRFVFIRV